MFCGVSKDVIVSLRLFRHAVVHIDVPAVLRLGIRKDVDLDSIRGGFVLVHPERQLTSPLYHTYVDGDMLAEVVERLPTLREQVVYRSYLEHSVLIMVCQQILVIEV